MVGLFKLYKVRQKRILPEHWDRECLCRAKYCNSIIERNLCYINHFCCYFWSGATDRLYEQSFAYLYTKCITLIPEGWGGVSLRWTQNGDAFASRSIKSATFITGCELRRDLTDRL